MQAAPDGGKLSRMRRTTRAVSGRGNLLRKALASLLAASLLAALAIACSSVPDLVFADADGAATGPATTSEGGPAPITGKDAGTPDGPYVVSCPSAPPIGGVCCGALPCYGCAQSACTQCADAGCATGDVCCQKGPNFRCEAERSCK